MVLQAPSASATKEARKPWGRRTVFVLSVARRRDKSLACSQSPSLQLTALQRAGALGHGWSFPEKWRRHLCVLHGFVQKVIHRENAGTESRAQLRPDPPGATGRSSGCDRWPWTDAGPACLPAGHVLEFLNDNSSAYIAQPFDKARSCWCAMPMRQEWVTPPTSSSVTAAHNAILTRPAASKPSGSAINS